MPTVDLTSNYLAQSLGPIKQLIGDFADPRNKALAEQYRREREMHPLKMAHLQGQTALDAARALTEGERQHLLGAQTSDVSAITDARNRLVGMASPQMPAPIDTTPVINQAARDFHAGLSATPGAVQALGSQVPQVAPLMPEQPSPVAEALAAPVSPDAPNPLLPPLAQPRVAINPQAAAVLAAAISKSPNPSNLVQALAQGEALNGGLTEQRSREVALGQGLLPNVNTAVTVDRQNELVKNKNQAAMDRVKAQQDGAMDRTLETIKGNNQRAVISPLAKALVDPGAGAPKYSDLRNMSKDAGAAADRVFGISRDPQGNPVSNVGVPLAPSVIAQRDRLAARTQGYIQQGLNPNDARDRAAVDLFGSANFGDAQFFTQPNNGWMPWTDRNFSAKKVNPEALGPVERAGNPALNGQSPLAAALLGQIPGTPAPAPAPAPGQPEVESKAENAADTTTEAAESASPVVQAATNPYAAKPSNEDLRNKEANATKAKALRAELADVERYIREGKAIFPNAEPEAAVEFTKSGLPVVPHGGDNDLHNAMVQKRMALLEEIARLEPETSGNNQPIGDIAKKYLNP